MQVTDNVKKILSYYESDNPGTKTNLCRILMSGKLAGTGKMIILPVDQGFEHGPARSFSINPDAYDPHYHYSLAVEAGLNAYAAPLGMIEAGASSFAGEIPLILKVNSANSLLPKSMAPFQGITGSVKDALRLGCVGIGFTIYPGSEMSLTMIEQVKEMAIEAKECGLVVVIWSYPRGENITKDGETALDVCAYAAHMAALIGAHIIKVKPPTNIIFQEEAKKIYNGKNFDIFADRVKHIRDACFKGKRIVVFSGGANKTTQDIYEETKGIRDGGGNGSIIGRNTFQRPKQEALEMLDNLVKIYLGKN